MMDQMKLGNNLSQLCKERGITLAHLSKMSGVPKSTIHSWTTNPASVNLSHLQKIARALGVSVHFLAYGENDPNEAPSENILKEIFSGDVRVTLHRIERRRGE